MANLPELVGGRACLPIQYLGAQTACRGRVGAGQARLSQKPRPGGAQRHRCGPQRLVRYDAAEECKSNCAC